MIHTTPQVSDASSDDARSIIMENYPGFEDCFVWLHPFLKIKEGHDELIKFESTHWPNKFEIETHCVPITWSEILHLSGIQDLKALD